MKIDVPFKPKFDHDHFSLPNGLDVLLLSDPTTEQAAASLCVPCGYFSDPEGLPGLAHFCEHMLFLGTEKYPDDSEYRSFISGHGGKFNAYTASEETNYQFDIAAEHLDGALDRFAQFFVAPLFTEGATDRELKAIDSEHEKNLQNDVWRFWQLVHQFANPDFPFHKFGTGNRETLEVRAAASGINTREQLFEFVKQHYSAHLMKLCVFGKEPVEQLRETVTRLFSPIKRSEVARPLFAGFPLTKAELGYWVDLVPVKQLRQVTLIFPIDCGEDEYRTKPYRYSTFLIGHESEGSLLAYLKQQAWATALVAGEAMTGKHWGLFYVEIDLTEDGLAHTDDVLLAVFQYISFIRTAEINHKVWQEIKSASDMEFRFLEMHEPFSTTMGYAANMHKYAPQHIISGDFLCESEDVERERAVLQQLNPGNVNVYVKSKAAEAECTERSEWYGVAFRRRRIAEEQLAVWREPPANAQLHFPALNPFMPESFDLKPAPAEAAKAPAPLVDTPAARLWFQQDTTFGVPKAFVQLRVVSPVVYGTPRLRAQCRLFENLLREALNSITYHAEMANLQFKLAANTHGFVVNLTGFDNKISELAGHVLRALAEFGEVDASLFGMMRDKVKRTMANAMLDQPYAKALENFAQCLSLKRWSPLDVLAELDGLTTDDLARYVKEYLRSLWVEGLVYGNLTAEEAQRFHDELLRPVLLDRSTPLPVKERPTFRYVRVPPGKEWCHLIADPNPNDPNSAVVVYLQMGVRSHRLVALTDVLLRLLDSPFYSVLRTREQLGYIVKSAPRSDGVVEGILFLVQSAIYSPYYVYGRIRHFLDAFGEHLRGLSEQDLRTCIDAEVTVREDAPKSQQQQGEKLWQEIAEREPLFDRDQHEIAALRQVTHADLVAFWDAKCSNASAERSLLVSMVAGNKHAAVATQLHEAHPAEAAPKEEQPEADEEADAEDPEGAQPEEAAAAEETDAAAPAAKPMFAVPHAEAAVTLHFIFDPPRWAASCEAFPATVANH